MMARCWCVRAHAARPGTSLTSSCLQAIASSYTFEEGERDHPLDSIFVRPISEAEVKPKPRLPSQ